MLDLHPQDSVTISENRYNSLGSLSSTTIVKRLPGGAQTGMSSPTSYAQVRTTMPYTKSPSLTVSFISGGYVAASSLPLTLDYTVLNGKV